VESILSEIKHWKDIICFDVMCSINWWIPKKVIYWKDFENENLPDYYKRKPNHLMCYKRDIIKDKWRDVTYWEDYHFGNDIVKHLTSESRIDKVLYFYNYNEYNTECPKTSDIKY
jgi:hypothetical protein